MYLRAAITPAIRAVILSISGARCACFGFVDRIRTASDCKSVAMGRRAAARIVSPDSGERGEVATRMSQYRVKQEGDAAFFTHPRGQLRDFWVSDGDKEMKKTVLIGARSSDSWGREELGRSTHRWHLRGLAHRRPRRFRRRTQSRCARRRRAPR